RMRLVATIETRLREVPGATGCLSAATFAPPGLNSTAPLGVVRRAFFNSKLAANTKHFTEAGWLAQDGNEELWRISLRIRGIDDLDYAALAKTIQGAIDPLLDAQLK